MIVCHASDMANDANPKHEPTAPAYSMCELSRVRVRFASFALPAWLLVGLIAGIALAVGAWVGASGHDPRSVVASSAPAPRDDIPRAAQSSGPPAASASAPAVSSADLQDRAASGDLDALRRLELVPAAERGVGGSVAIARGHVQLRRSAIASLERDISLEPKVLDDVNTLARLHAFGGDPELYPDALPVIARLPGPLAPDMLYDLATRAPDGSNARILAEDLLREGDVHDRASPSLAVLIKLRSSRACHRVRSVVKEVLAAGDERSVPVLEALEGKTGCGADSEQDCYPCLRDDDLLARAKDAVKERKAPRPWGIER